MEMAESHCTCCCLGAGKLAFCPCLLDKEAATPRCWRLRQWHTSCTVLHHRGTNLQPVLSGGLFRLCLMVVRRFGQVSIVWPLLWMRAVPWHGACVP